MAMNNKKGKRVGDGNLYITFVAMGQGDCTLITCPNGKTIMIDCGTDRWEDTNPNAASVRDIVYSDNFLKDYNTLDVLILTHGDQDHYNQIYEVLDEDVVIHRLYHSSELSKYTAGGVGSWLGYTADVKKKRAITMNQSGVSINGKAVEDQASDDDIDKIATNNGVRVLKGKKGAGPECDVYVLAGNVTAYKNVKDNSNDKNRGSLVTLIEFDDLKIMICGDATINTEKYLLARYGDTIKNLEVLQVPHHGTSTTSSSDSFVNKVNPHTAIVSVANYSSSPKLPRYETLKKYHSKTRLNTPGNHNIGYWKQTKLNYTDGDGDDQTSRKSVYYFPLEPDEDGTVYTDDDTTGIVLTTLDKDIQLTGHNGSRDFEFAP